MYMKSKDDYRKKIMDEQKTGQRICPGCGKKIPAELHFCLYCMTRLTPLEDIDKKHAGLRKKKWICLVSVLLLAGVAFMLIGSAVIHRSGRQETLVAKATEQVKNTEKTSIRLRKIQNTYRPKRRCQQRHYSRSRR